VPTCKIYINNGIILQAWFDTTLFDAHMGSKLYTQLLSEML